MKHLIRQLLETKNREALWYCDVLGRLEKTTGFNTECTEWECVKWKSCAWNARVTRGLCQVTLIFRYSLDIRLRVQSPDHRHSCGFFKSQTTKSSPPTPTPPNHLTNTLHHHRHRHRHLTSSWKVNSLENCVQLYDIYYMYLIYTYSIQVHNIHKL